LNDDFILIKTETHSINKLNGVLEKTINWS